MQKVNNEEFELKVVSLLEEARKPVSIDYVRWHLQLQWNTARALLLSMALDGKIKGQKTSKSWIFSVKENPE